MQFQFIFSLNNLIEIDKNSNQKFCFGAIVLYCYKYNDRVLSKLEMQHLLLKFEKSAILITESWPTGLIFFISEWKRLYNIFYYYTYTNQKAAFLKNAAFLKTRPRVQSSIVVDINFLGCQIKSNFGTKKEGLKSNQINFFIKNYGLKSNQINFFSKNYGFKSNQIKFFINKCLSQIKSFYFRFEVKFFSN